MRTFKLTIDTENAAFFDTLAPDVCPTFYVAGERREVGALGAPDTFEIRITTAQTEIEAEEAAREACYARGFEHVHIRNVVEHDAEPPYTPAAEIVRILRVVADRIDRDGALEMCWAQTIFDVNGNDVGRYAIKDLNGNVLAPSQRPLT